MLTKNAGLVTAVMVAILLSLVWIGVARAETGPAELMVPGDWQEISGNQVHWYAFEYDYNTGIDGEDDPSYALVRMFVADEANGAGFTVWTQEQIDKLAIFDPDEEFVAEKWIGSGSFNENEIVKGDYVWAGNTMTDGIYYVKVYRTGLCEGPVYYKLEVNGEDVAIVQPAATSVELAEAPAPAVEAVPELAMEAAPEVAMVTEAQPRMVGPVATLKPGEWRTLEGDEEWYAFHYDAYFGPKGEDDPSKVTVAMFVEDPVNGAQFSIWDAAGLDELAIYDPDREPAYELCIGCSGLNEAVPADYTWEGNFRASGDYYVRVNPTGLSSGPIIYKLEISGDDVAVLPATETTAIAATPAPIMEPQVMPAETEATAEAELKPGQWVALEPGQEHWYSFNYRADFGIEGDEVPTNVEIAMFVDDPANRAEFTVWTPEQLAKLYEWDATREYDRLCVGCGTLDEILPADYTWSGHFTSSGTYFVRVKPTGMTPGTVVYKLTISGDDVAF